MAEADVVGCGIDWPKRHLFFTLNGERLGKSDIYPWSALRITWNDWTSLLTYVRTML